MNKEIIDNKLLIQYFTKILIVIILFLFFFLFYSCVGCGTNSDIDLDDGSTTGEDGDSDGDDGSDSIIVTGNIDRNKAAEQAALLPLPSTPTGDDIVVTSIILRSDLIGNDLIGRSDYFKYEGEESADSEELYNDTLISEGGTFELTVPSDDTTFYLAIAVKTGKTKGVFESKDGVSDLTVISKIESKSLEEDRYNYVYSMKQKGKYDVGSLSWQDGKLRAQTSMYNYSKWYPNDCSLLLNGAETDKLFLMEEETSTYNITTSCTGDLTHYFSLMEGDFCNLAENSDGTATLTCEPSTQDWQSIGITTAMMGVQSGSKYGVLNFGVFISESDKEKPTYIYNENTNQKFGTSIFLNDNCLLIGAPSSDNTGGSVFMYAKGEDGWKEIKEFTSTSGIFGTSIAADDSCGRVVVGATNSNTGIGTTYVYSSTGVSNPTNLASGDILWLVNSVTGSSNFGGVVAVLNDGSYFATCDKSANNFKGEGYLYQTSDLQLKATFKPQLGTTFSFCTSLVLGSNSALVGGQGGYEANFYNFDGSINKALNYTGGLDVYQNVAMGNNYAVVASGSNVHLYNYSNSIWSETKDSKIDNSGGSTTIYVAIYGQDKFVAYNTADKKAYLTKAPDWVPAEIETNSTITTYDADKSVSSVLFQQASSISVNANYYAIGYTDNNGMVVVAPIP